MTRFSGLTIEPRLLHPPESFLRTQMDPSSFPPLNLMNMFPSHDAPTCVEPSSDSYVESSVKNLARVNLFDSNSGVDHDNDELSSDDSRSESLGSSEDSSSESSSSEHRSSSQAILRDVCLSADIISQAPSDTRSPLDSNSDGTLSASSKAQIDESDGESSPDDIRPTYDVSRYSDPFPFDELDAKLRLIAFSRTSIPCKPNDENEDTSNGSAESTTPSSKDHSCVSGGVLSATKKEYLFSSGSKRKLSHDHETSTELESEDETIPTSKRTKNTHSPRSSGLAKRKSRTHYLAHEPAAIRRSLSLRSAMVGIPESDSVPPRGQTSRYFAKERPTPFLEKPTGPIVIVPSSQFDVSLKRVSRLLEREVEHRQLDGLPRTLLGPVREPIEDSQVKEWGSISITLRSAVIDWINQVMPRVKKSHRSEVGNRREESFANLKDHLRISTETRALAVLLFIRYFHRKGNHWSKAFGIESHGGFSSITDDLEDHEDDPDTWETNRDQDGLARMYGNVVWERLVWDIALACLCISTKFYHDFLHPLYPIFLPDFRRLAASGMDDDELELTQKEVLRTFNYEIYEPTPQAYFSEFEICLPALMSVVNDLDVGGEIDDDGCASSPWVFVKVGAWEIIKEVAREADFIRFSTSLMTCATLLDVVMEQLIEEYGKEPTRARRDNTSSSSASVSRIGKTTFSYRDQRSVITARRTRAESALKDVREEMGSVLGLTEDDIAACRVWLCMVSSH